MKKTTLLAALLLGHISFCQVNIDQILELGIENAQRFSQDYFKPAGEGLITGLSNGWYNSASSKKKFHFEIGFVGNGSFVRKEKQSFTLDTRDYTEVSFVGTSDPRQEVANAYGENSQDIVVVLGDETGDIEVTLPDGFGGTGVNFIPTAFIQASVGLPRGSEFKVRFLPKFDVGKNTEISSFGVALQNEITSWLYSGKRWPVKVSGIVGYTFLKGSYDFTADSVIDGADQEIQLKTNSWLISGIVSTKLPVLNFYAGFGFYAGSNNTALKGLYRVGQGPIASLEVIDPISVDHKESGVKATIGSMVSYGILRVNLDYTLQNYNNLSLGIKIGF